MKKTFVILILLSKFICAQESDFIGIYDGENFCTYHSPKTLTALNNNSGIFTGPGITDFEDGTASFDPAIAGIGTHRIHYKLGDLELDFVSISAGQYRSAGIKNDGTLWMWGDNTNGLLGDGTTTGRLAPVQIGSDNDWSKVNTYSNHTVAIKNNGTLWAWGNNNAGQLGDGTTTMKTIPTQIGSDSDWLDISVGEMYTVAIKTDGSLWTWGYNQFGQLADGTYTDRSTPAMVGNGYDWYKVACSFNHIIALKTDGTLWAWGSNSSGQLGDGTSTKKNTPQKIGNNSDWKEISAGGFSSSAIKTDGTLWSWGDNFYGQLGDGTFSDKNTPNQIGAINNWSYVSVGYSHMIALKTDGTLWAWGDNYDGQLGDGTSTKKNTPNQIGTDNTWGNISAGYRHNLATTESKLRAWGWNPTGQLGDGTTTLKNSPEIIYSITIKNIIVHDNPLGSYTQYGNMLLADEGNFDASYQWIDCNNSNQPILGETRQKFYPSTSGSYAVEITLYGCVSISSCSPFILGINSYNHFPLTLYPNPTEGILFIDNIFIHSSYTIINSLGLEIMKGIIDNNKTIDMNSYADGIYFLRIEDKSFKIIKQ